jgi:glycogen debranching enzyme
MIILSPIWNNVEKNTVIEGSKIARVVVLNQGADNQIYSLSSNIPLRPLKGNKPADQEVFFEEKNDQSIIRTGNNILDALFALAHHEARQNTEDVKRGWFAGEEWEDVWMRDLSYSVQLALASVNPELAKTSLRYKLNKLKTDPRNTQLMQDSGSGGSYPISTDRVVWAFAAFELLKYLDDSDFFKEAYLAIKHTVEHDYEVIYDNGLYRGEESFLDWREQTYPAWTKLDTLPIGMSKALSTNILHFKILEVASKLAEKINDPEEIPNAIKYHDWANSLKKAINEQFYNKDSKLYCAMIFNDIKMNCYDLLGQALAVNLNIADENQAKLVVQKYPHTNIGTPVVFPQRNYLPPYHNRAIWPFVTAYWIKAAAKVKNASAVDHGINFLIQSAAFNLSHMENFEFLTGNNSDTVINSHRQLWSLAGFIAIVQDVIFGLDVSSEGIRFLPFITNNLLKFLQSGQIVLKHFTYRKKTIDVIIHLPPVAASQQGGYYNIDKIKLNGDEIGMDYIPFSSLTNQNKFEIGLAGLNTSESINLITDNNSSLHWAPREPDLISINPVNGQLQLKYSASGEPGVSFNIYRNGVLKADNLQETTWIDTESSDYHDNTYFYAVQAVSKDGNVSFPSRTMCHITSENLQIFEAKNFTANGGELIFNHGMWHFQNWGDSGHTLITQPFSPKRSGFYQVSVLYGNGLGPVNAGLTCVVKKLSVFFADNETEPVKSQILVMPHLVDWDSWKDSSSFQVELDSSKSYQIEILEDQDPDTKYTINMSFFDQIDDDSKPETNNHVNIAMIKLLFVPLIM